MNYSYFTGVKKALVYGVIFLIASYIDSIVGQNLYGVNEITVGAILVFLRNYLKTRVGLKFV